MRGRRLDSRVGSRFGRKGQAIDDQKPRHVGQRRPGDRRRRGEVQRLPRGRNAGDTQTCRGPRPYRDHRGPAVRGFQTLPGLDAGRVDDAPLQPNRQAPARVTIGGSNNNARGPPFAIYFSDFWCTCFYVCIFTYDNCKNYLQLFNYFVTGCHRVLWMQSLSSTLGWPRYVGGASLFLADRMLAMAGRTASFHARAGPTHPTP